MFFRYEKGKTIIKYENIIRIAKQQHNHLTKHNLNGKRITKIPTPPQHIIVYALCFMLKSERKRETKLIKIIKKRKTE